MSEKDNNLANWKMLKSDSYLFVKPNSSGKVCQSAVVKIFTKGSNKLCGFAYNREKEMQSFYGQWSSYENNIKQKVNPKCKT